MRFHPIFSYTYAYILALAEFELQDHTYSTLESAELLHVL